MQQFCQYGSVRGATGNRRPYRDISYTLESFFPISFIITMHIIICHV